MATVSYGKSRRSRDFPALRDGNWRNIAIAQVTVALVWSWPAQTQLGVDLFENPAPPRLVSC